MINNLVNIFYNINFQQFKSANFTGKTKQQVLFFSCISLLVVATTCLIVRRIYTRLDSNRIGNIFQNIISRTPKNDKPTDLDKPTDVNKPMRVEELHLPTDEEVAAFRIHPGFFKRQIVTIDLDEAPSGATMQGLAALLDKYSSVLPEIIIDEGNVRTKQQVIQLMKNKFSAIEESYRNPEQRAHYIEKGDVKRVRSLLLHILVYMQKIDRDPKLTPQEKNDKIAEDMFLKEFIPAFLHCGDRVLFELRSFYSTNIMTSSEYVESMTFSNIVLLQLEMLRREILEHSINEIMIPICEKVGSIDHYAATARHYLRILHKEVGLLGEPDGISKWERQGHPFVTTGYEPRVRKLFNKNYTAKNIIDQALALIQSTDKHKNIKSEMASEFFKENYKEFDPSLLLDEDLMTWNRNAVALLLKDLGVLA